MHTYTARETTNIYWEDYETCELDPRLVIVRFKNGSTKHHRLDIGALCYTRRNNVPGEATHVDITSYKPDRLDALRKLINYALRQPSGATAYAYHTRIIYLFNFIDNNKLDINFCEPDQLIELYIKFTDHLLDRMNQPKMSGNKIGKTHASATQIRAAEWIALITNKHTIEVQGACSVIDQSGKPSTRTLPAPFDDQKRCVAVHLEIFSSISTFLMRGADFPLIMKADETTVYYYSQQNGSCLALKLASDQRLLTWDETLEKARHMGVVINNEQASRFALETYTKELKKFNSNKEFNSRRINLANRAIVSFFYAFIAATTANNQVAFGLQPPQENDELEAPFLSTKGMRFTGMKARAGHKLVNIEFGLRFKPHFLNYLEFREWLLLKLDIQTPNLFFSITHDTGGKNPFAGTLSHDSLESLKRFYVKRFPNSPWLSSQKLRRGGANYFLTETGSPIIAAQKLSNTPETILRNYLDTSFEQAASEIGKFLSAMYQQAIFLSRTTEERIPVHIVNDEGINTPTAHCGSNTSTPLLAEGFNAQAPQPDCGNPETCLFCKHFVMHADSEDICKILSLHEVLSRIKNKTLNHDHFNAAFGPTLYRIDEIIDQLHDEYPHLREITAHIKGEIQRGKLDTFWSIHYDLLVDLGYIE